MEKVVYNSGLRREKRDFSQRHQQEGYRHVDLRFPDLRKDTGSWRFSGGDAQRQTEDPRPAHRIRPREHARPPLCEAADSRKRARDVNWRAQDTTTTTNNWRDTRGNRDVTLSTLAEQRSAAVEPLRARDRTWTAKTERLATRRPQGGGQSLAWWEHIAIRHGKDGDVRRETTNAPERRALTPRVRPTAPVSQRSPAQTAVAESFQLRRSALADTPRVEDPPWYVELQNRQRTVPRKTAEEARRVDSPTRRFRRIRDSLDRRGARSPASFRSDPTPQENHDVDRDIPTPRSEGIYVHKPMYRRWPAFSRRCSSGMLSDRSTSMGKVEAESNDHDDLGPGMAVEMGQPSCSYNEPPRGEEGEDDPRESVPARSEPKSLSETDGDSLSTVRAKWEVRLDNPPVLPVFVPSTRPGPQLLSERHQKPKDRSLSDALRQSSADCAKIHEVGREVCVLERRVASLIEEVEEFRQFSDLTQSEIDALVACYSSEQPTTELSEAEIEELIARHAQLRGAGR